MTYTSDRPITVDGVRLDTLAWNITKVAQQTAGRRSADTVVPGVDGVTPSLNDTLEPAAFALDMFVRGTDVDGVTPGAGTRTTFRDNLDNLVHLFGKRHALLDVRETVAAGVERRALAKVVDTLTPDVNDPGSVGTFTVSMTLPYGVWEDVTVTDWTSGQITSGQVVEVTSLQGGSERVLDAEILVLGPVTNPVLEDESTGAYVSLAGSLAAGEEWRINCATWATRKGTTLALGDPDTAGTDQQAVTSFGGTKNQAAFLPLVPVRDVAGVRRTYVSLTGTGITTATRVSIRARRKYAI